ncbi:MAG: hypothetical protein HND52_12690 [Ignavibacteriae bacterium]|nr:hypothetical protein [Ignavibacteriota bacterium]NOG98808.1 hypothetical protein [Ignavibacteriota bacterium]
MSLTLGCDPELICRINGKFTSASNYFKSNSSMGLDGNNSVAELRPGYSESPIDLTAKIRTVLEYGHECNEELEFYSGHYVDGYPIGGHIHVAAKPTSELVDSLDTVLTALSNCIDDKPQKEKREHSGYGQRKQYRCKEYGMEYRTPGSWLLSPSTTLVTLTLTKLVTVGVQEDGLNFTDLKGRSHSCTFLRNLKSMLRTIPEDCTEGLSELGLLLSRSCIDWNQNILPNWGIGNAEQIREAA